MIEVEVKIPIDTKGPEALIATADFIGEHNISDTYYDTKDFSLTTKDIWLRRRNIAFELKLPVHTKELKNREADQYHELTTETDIRRELQLSPRASLSEDLQTVGYQPFASFTTIRQAYKKDQFNIVIDRTDFGYVIAEVELLVNNQKQVLKAQQRIVDFVTQLGYQYKSQGGKAIAYGRKHNPALIQALVKAGNINS